MSKADQSFVTVGGKKPKKRMTAAQRRKRRKIQKMIAGGVLLLLVLFIWYGIQPFRGNMDYGICRTFAELRAGHPETMRIISYENYGSSWKIFYSYIGEYGEQKSNFIDCTFTNDPVRGHRIMKEVKINRIPVEKELLDRFNLSIPGVIAGKPDLVIPAPLSETDLRGLRNN